MYFVLSHISLAHKILFPIQLWAPVCCEAIQLVLFVLAAAQFVLKNAYYLLDPSQPSG